MHTHTHTQTHTHTCNTMWCSKWQKLYEHIYCSAAPT